jgi:hypothetical protein
MKRIAWLLLALSLPAWATINGVDSSRVVLPSFDGTRYGAYVAGDYPETPPGVIWTQDFEGIANGTVLSKANMDSTYEALEGLGYNSICDEGVTISDTVARSGSQSLKVFNDLINPANSGPTGCTSTTKARVEILIAANQYKTTNTIGNGHGFTFGSERWIGYSMYFPTSGNSGWSTSIQPIIFQIIGDGAPTGDPDSPILMLRLGSGGKFGVETAFSADAGDLTSSQDYLQTAGRVYDPSFAQLTPGQWATLKDEGSSGAEYHLKNLAGTSPLLSRDTWHDVVIHFKKGDTVATGLIEIWLDGVKVVDVPAFPTTVSDFDDSYIKIGAYHGSTTAGSETYTMYVDSMRIYDEQGTFNAVDPAQDD